jgi:antitoxin (DNA-binding transcriptional repressor) of toxin-antitoxin stability system
MVMVAKGYDLDYAGRAVGEAYRGAGYYPAATEAGEPPGTPVRARPANGWACRNATYMTYIRNMSENPVPLPYEVQEMTTTEARKHLPELVNMAAYGHVTTVLIRDGRRLARIVPEEDAWVYSPAWQEQLREAEADLAAGRVQRFEDDDEFLGHLDAVADEAGG